MIDHLERNSILTTLNHGFCTSYSCETQLVTTVHDLLTNHDTKTQVDMAILDFSKVIDTVPHNKLLHKRELYGINGNINAGRSEFLTNRQTRVVVDGIASGAANVDSGVPQGAILGPIFSVVT